MIINLCFLPGRCREVDVLSSDVRPYPFLGHDLELRESKEAVTGEKTVEDELVKSEVNGVLEIDIDNHGHVNDILE